MLTRVAVAFGAGLAVYLVAMLMTTCDGILSLLLQPIMGSLITGLTVVAAVLVGSPLLFDACWVRWRRFWLLPTAMLVAAPILLVLSWLPFRVEIVDSDTGLLRPDFNPVLGAMGWCALIVALVWHPLIGVTRTRKWA